MQYAGILKNTKMDEQLHEPLPEDGLVGDAASMNCRKSWKERQPADPRLSLKKRKLKTRSLEHQGTEASTGAFEPWDEDWES